MASDTSARPTNVRYGVLVLATLVAILLYLHRYCLSTADRDIKQELDLTEAQMATVLGAFFFSYALCQIPSGLLADRYGPRMMLTFYIVVWSVMTGLLGVAQGYVGLLALRLGVGVFEAGAYPACAGIIRRWIPYPQRGLASGVVSLGGRLGGAITPTLTAGLMVAFAVWLSTGGWRPVMALYGLFGIGVAVAFWWLFRDRPGEHPACNHAEAELIRRDDPNPERHDAATPVGLLFLGVFKNFSLWMCSLVQFGINFGWVFLFTYLNRYLDEVHHVPLALRGTMITLVISLSLPALLVGGWLTDRMTRGLGQRWGRSLPLVLSRFVAAAAFLAVPFVSDAWTIVLLLGAVAFFSDLGLPAIWAYNMDVGGRNVGFVLGWGNMWGNLGAFLSPIALNLVVEHYLLQGETIKFAWDAVFLTCGAVFVFVGVTSLCVDATKRVEAEASLPPHIERALYDDDKTELLGPPARDAASVQFRAARDDITEHVPKPPQIEDALADDPFSEQLFRVGEDKTELIDADTFAQTAGMSHRRPAVFLDRDGTLIEDIQYLADPALVRLLPGSAEALQLLRGAGFACVVATNQSGVGRGIITLDQLSSIHREMEWQLADAGAALDGIYWCSHLPQLDDKTVIEHVDRKPGPGMLLLAARDFNLDLAASWIVGDQVGDMLTGRNAGCKGGILVRTGHDLKPAFDLLGHDWPVADDLLAAAKMIIHRSHLSPPGASGAR